MIEVVLDASAAVEALTGTAPERRDLRKRLAVTSCHAPHLIDAEVGSILRRRHANGMLTAVAAASALHALESVIDERYAHAPFADAAWRLRDNLTFYDALYVALAARLSLPLLTADARLARAPGLPCPVEVISPRPAPS